MDDLYREYLLDHYKNPKNKEKLEGCEIHKKESNPLCGDEIEIYIKLEKDKGKNNENKKDGAKELVKRMTFQGTGCVISMASASILSEDLEGKSLDEIRKMDTDYMLKLLGLELTPSRIKCAMLALSTAKKAIIEYESRKQE